MKEKGAAIKIIFSDGGPVNAAAAGTVVDASKRVTRSGDYENFIAISHERGYSTFYYFNGTLLVKQWDVVQQGDKIAEVDHAGSVVFRLRYIKKYEDPLKLLPAIR